jgi:hypothetical protein
MKRILSFSIFTILLLSFGACKKVNTNSNGTSPIYVRPTTGSTTTTPVEEVPILGIMPQEFTKKAVIEEATGVWCGYCPHGAYHMNNACTANPDKVYGVAYHRGDVFSSFYDVNTTAANEDFYSGLGMSGVPSGVVNRDQSTDNYNVWESASASEILKVAKCGIGIATKKVSDIQYSIEVHAGFNTTLSGDYRLVLYVLEDGVHKGSSYDQHNYMDGDAGSPWEGKGDPMSASNYVHNHVFRQAITPNFKGDVITTSKIKPNGEFIKTYVLDMNPEWNESKTSVIAMIVKVGTSPSTHYVENAQECKLGEIKKWD